MVISNIKHGKLIDGLMVKVMDGRLDGSIDFSFLCLLFPYFSRLKTFEWNCRLQKKACFRQFIKAWNNWKINCSISITDVGLYRELLDQQALMERIFDFSLLNSALVILLLDDKSVNICMVTLLIKIILALLYFLWTLFLLSTPAVLLEQLLHVALLWISTCWILTHSECPQ